MNIDAQDWLNRQPELPEEDELESTEESASPSVENNPETEDEDVIKKEMATPPRPGLVFDRNRHRWIRPVVDIPKEKNEPITDFTSLDFPGSNPYDALKTYLKNTAEGRPRVPIQDIEDILLQLWHDQRTDGPKAVCQFVDTAIQNAMRSSSNRDVLKDTESVLSSVLEYVPYDERIAESLRMLLENRDHFKLPSNAPEYMNQTYSSNLYTGPEGFRKKYSNVLLQGVQNINDLDSMFRISYNLFSFVDHEALIDKIIEALKSWNLNTNGEYMTLADDFLVLLSDVKPSRLEEYTTEGLRLFDKWKAEIPGSDSIANYGREVFRSAASHSLEAIKQIGLPAIKHYAETRELKLDFSNEFRKMLEDIPREDTLDPGVRTKKVVSILMQDIGLKDIHEQLRDDWEAGCTTPGALLIAETAGKLYDGERKHYNDEEEDAPIYTEYPSEKLKEYVKAHYELTQQMLKYTLKGQETVTIYRGTTSREANVMDDVTEGGEIQVDPNSVSSWSLSKDIAYKFASKKKERGVVLKGEIPVSSIYGYCASYCYKGNEREFLVINDPKNKYYLEKFGLSTREYIDLENL